LLSAHYRQPLDWSAQLLADSKARLERWGRALAGVSPSAPSDALLAALADDLNTPQALAVLSAEAKSDPAAAAAGLALMGVMLPVAAAPDARIEARIAERSAARAARNWAEADRIRNELLVEGILIEDGPGGTTWRHA
jgi:cysteinyl-tRNA synthetase